MPRLAGTAFAVSAGVLGFEIALMRVLLVASWHHFAFLVISVALLGFGASGTALSLLRAPLLRRATRALPVLVTLTAVSMPLCQQLAQHVPVEARFLPALLGRQVSVWILYWALLLVPFLLGAGVLGLTLMLAEDRIPRVYAANLAGSAGGAVLTTALMGSMAPAWLACVLGGVTLLGAVPAMHRRVVEPAAGTGAVDRPLLGLVLASVACAGVVLALDPPWIRLDPFQYESAVRRLVDGGQARRVAGAHDRRAEIAVYASTTFYEMPFLAVGAQPPPLLAVVMDGHWAGSLLRVADPDSAGVVDRSLSSLPYAFLGTSPRVLLLGETGGADTWLALRHGAAVVDVVQPSGALRRLMRGPLRGFGGLVFEQPGVRWNETEPRAFVERGRAKERYELVQLVGIQSWAVETGGVGGLSQDDLLTVEGLTACLRRISPSGLLSMCRGIQLPPRDNLKLLATAIAALRRMGVEDPGRHLVVLRDFLGACTLVKITPWTEEEIEDVRRLCRERQLTPVIFPGVHPDELNRPDALPGPEGGAGDWLHHGIQQLLSRDAASFVASWPFDVRPPTDDRPFFANFSKLGAIGALRRAFGDLWLTRTELSLLFALAAAFLVAVAGATLTWIPLALMHVIGDRRGLVVVAAYFFCLGLGYLLLEMVLLSRFTHLLGDPILAGAVTIAGLLLFSGVGSLLAPRVTSVRALRRLLFAAVLVGAVETLPPGASVVASGLPQPLRILVALAALAPLGVLLGFPMPAALARLQRDAPAQVPWAWGVNGFASVLAAPVATAMGMLWGFSVAAATALGLYAMSAVLAGRLFSPPSGTGPR